MRGIIIAQLAKSTKAVGVSGNRLKIAFNSNGMVINGADVSMASYAEYFQRLYSDLTRAIEIGSTYGNHSNQHYNEISVLKGFLSVQEMKELTSV